MSGEVQPDTGTAEMIAGPVKMRRPGVSAREISKWSMFCASVWISSLSLLKAFWGVLIVPPIGQVAPVFGLTMGDILLSGTALAAMFSPIYLSIWLDKVKDIKLGGGA